MTIHGASAPDAHDGGFAVLAVDDESSVLSALGRLLRPDGVRLLTATGADEALSILDEHAASIGVVISDYAMPGRTGAELLRVVRLRWPDITRVMLTGNADLPAAARAVNEGQLSRLYTKPWQPDEFRHAVGQAVEQHRMLMENRRLRALADEQAVRLEQWNQRLELMVAQRTAELEQANASLHRGLLESVKLLLTMLERRLPARAAHCRQVARLAGRLAERSELNAEEVRRVQVAALVHDIGLVGLPDSVLRRTPALLPPAERTEYQRHPVTGQTMLAAVEQLADLGEWIRHHHERWDGQGYPDGLAGAAIPLPSRVIGLADAYLEAVAREGSTAAFWRREQRHSGAFDAELFNRLEDEISGAPIRNDISSRGESTTDEFSIPILDLQPGTALSEPIQTTAGAVLVPAGERLTPDQVDRVQRLLAAGALAGDTVVVKASAD